MAETKAAPGSRGGPEPTRKKGRREKQKYRGGKSMIFRFLLALAVLSGVRIAIPVEIFFAWPSIVRNSIIAIPPMLCAVFMLNTALPDRAFRSSSYVLMLLLLFPMTLMCDFVQVRFEAIFLPWNENYAITAWERIFITAIPVFILNLMITISFIIIWRAAFTGGLRLRTRWWTLLNPFFWGVGFLGVLATSYISLLELLMKVGGDPLLRYNLRLPEEIPSYYQITPLGNLLVTYAYLPLQVFTLSFMLLWTMRMLRRGYMESLPTPPPQPDESKPHYAESRPGKPTAERSPAPPRQQAPAAPQSTQPAQQNTQPAAPAPSYQAPTFQSPQRQAFSQEEAKTDEQRGPQRPL